MKRKKRTSITVETTRVLIVTTGKARLNWCRECAEEVQMLTLDEAATVARTSAVEIFRRIEGREIHSVRTPGNPLLICTESLLKQP
ncbi:MAG: hypothetical protein M3362_07900 [Acidobacteriota bacterium]|nr:hypothetical protein [Acidobacteriota bacterium]